MFLNELPFEILENIILYLPNIDYCNSRLINIDLEKVCRMQIDYRKYHGKNLLQLCEKGDLKGVKYIIERENGDPNLNLNAFRCGWSLGIPDQFNHPLTLCAYYNHSELIKYLVFKGSIVRAHNDNALKWMVFNNNLEMVQFLEERGANINQNYLLEYTRFDDDRVLRHLLFKRNNFDEIYDTLLESIELNHLDLVKFTINLIKLKSSQYDELFIIACNYNSFRVAKWFYSTGKIYIHAKDNFAYKCACKNKFLEIMKWLYSLGGFQKN